MAAATRADSVFPRRAILASVLIASGEWLLANALISLGFARGRRKPLGFPLLPWTNGIGHSLQFRGDLHWFSTGLAQVGSIFAAPLLPA